MRAWPGLWGLLLVVAALQLQPSSAHRALLQSDAVSNSNGCLSTIPKCEPGACATRNVLGVAQWVCLRCLGNYEPVVDASGQDNILQCVCPRGTYEAAANASSCSRCDANSYCPGGDKVQSPSSRGDRVGCGTNLVTRNTGARTQADCVAPAGYAQTSPDAATPCSPSSYAPWFNRLGKCLKCQSGLEEPQDSGLQPTDRGTKKNVCKVPPGRYMSQGLVRWCPQGFHRENYTAFDAPVAQICLPCQPGITTSAAGAPLASNCSRVLPGYGIQALPPVASPSDIPVLVVNASGLPAAYLCQIGYYSAGGYCVQCPSGTVTQNPGAQAIEECGVPPGYFIQASSLVQCGPGTYREGWLMFSNPRALNCTACGPGIQSEARDWDVNPLAANGSLVRALSTSCFIEAGQGMIASGRNTFSGVMCPANTYGAAGRVYGLTAAPCKPCPRNMITDGASGVNTSDACINPDGFGYASEGASRCAPGFYSLKGSRRPCAKCGFGRSTANDPLLQRLPTDCYVMQGYGLVSASASNSSDGYVLDTSNMSDDVAAALPVLECPVGAYGPGMTLRSTCVPCPAGSTTEDTQSSSPAQCSICLPGYGIQSTQQCSPCGFGSFQPGGSATCSTCPAATFYAPVDGVGDTWTSQGTTLFMGAIGEEFCVPRESQLSPDAGQAYFSSNMLPKLTQSQAASTLGECLKLCPPSSGCMVQFDAAALTCYWAALPWDPAGPNSTPGSKLMYKLPPSTLGSASSLKGGNGTLHAAVWTGSPPPSGNSTASTAAVQAAAVQAAAVQATGALGPRTARLRNSSSSTAGSSNSSTKATPLAGAAAGQVQPGSGSYALRAKGLSSGLYARLALDANQAPVWGNAGVPLDAATAQSFKWGSVPEWDAQKSEADCQQKCDNSVVCWGFLYDTASSACSYKGGEDALKTRSFFVMPDMTTVRSSSMSQQQPAASG